MERSFRLSRRAMIRAMSAAPLVGFALSAEAQEEIATTVATSCPPEQQPKVVRVANALWADFERGVKFECRTRDIKPALPIDAGVFRRAFELSGRYVVDNLERFPDDFPAEVGPDPKPGETLDCCGACGIKAVEAAVAAQKSSIDIPSFDSAWCSTKDAYSALLARLLSKQEPTTRQNMQALGCG